ncbi:DUF2244 domain-containing protein [Wenxinia marina]|uniref:Integral membrane protein n=1 Tax=Wenxinia marina DSM 24838 TaxID=1123501 RepID=A0A0D0PCU5_9RHOB|nr:DUF2244 domain-containing protein [Wenxinia marina]KIQ69211.1 Integral membrane protein [Wenxinia marina DSM 24838]GGL71186.1 hypothetical protein GCM10011392_27200 [Wenxinia marina]
MPYRWTIPEPDPGAPAAELHLWPHRSLPPVGFVWAISFMAVMLALPLVAVLGSAVLWGLLPFLLGAIAALWWALRRSTGDGALTEVLGLWPDRMRLVRSAPRKAEQTWEADPYWVEIRLHEEGGPVEGYLTLRGAGREVELGAFLSPEERRALRTDLQRRVAALSRRPDA